jgi:acetoin:2,6-dichlorophenolindophenol oxidoreductase subunit beta
MIPKGLAAAEKLAAEGIEVEVVDPRTLNPLDVETIVASVKKTGRVVIAHEAYERGGIAGEIAMQIMENAFDYLDAPIVRVAGRNVPIPYNLKLERAAVPQEEDIVAAIREIVPR